MNIPRYGTLLSTAMLITSTSVAMARSVTVDINRISDAGVGEKIGTVVVGEAKRGLSFKVVLKGVPQGRHGFHVHEIGDCGPAMKDGKMTAGVAAGEHFDPNSRKAHKGPTADGHKGDLPVLRASAKGIDQSVQAPRLTLAEISGRALVVHEGGDNYKDNPENGGGAGRIACGVVPKQ
jgi:superoxide dismutase, Cu-Zn family